MLTITNIHTTTNKPYRVLPLALQAVIYRDRDYFIREIPALVRGAQFIQTANDDKADINPNFLSFVVDVPCVVYVAYDRRSTLKPLWLSTFDETAHNLVTSDATLQLFFQKFVAGMITLGGNGQAQGSMYTVLITPQGEVVEPIPPVEPPPDEKWNLVDNSVPGVVTIETPIAGRMIRFTMDSRRIKPHG